MNAKLKIKLPIKEVFKPIIKNGFESPIGWWKVTTEGDCEGRSTAQLGEYYGHVAEIAFHLANKCFYSLNFAPIKDRTAGTHPEYQATKTEVWVQLDIESGTWDMNGPKRVKWVANWLDAKDEIDVAETNGYAYYYASVFIKMKL